MGSVGKACVSYQENVSSTMLEYEDRIGEWDKKGYSKI